jgi:hypothetical protein
MRASPSTPISHATERLPLRIRLRGTAAAAGAVDGAWWPQSRDLQAEAADLVDHLPTATGRINRLLFSRPDWDEPVVDGRGVRRIRAARGPIKVGSFPHDDTHLMVLTMASGRRLRLAVVPSDADPAEAERQLAEASYDGPPAQA